MAYIGVSPSNGVRRKHTYTATAAQTSFSGAGAEGITLGYLDSNYVDVYQNGVKLSEADYVSTSGTAIVLATGATASDMIEVVVYDVFSVADTVSKSAGGTFDGNITAAGTITVTGNADLNGDLDVDGTTNLDVVDIDGAVDMATTLAVGGVVTANAGVVVDNITVDGTTIALSSGDLTLDVAGDIILDAGGQNIIFKDDGTEFGQIYQSSNHLHLYSAINNADIKIQGNDGGATITAIELDMSDAGTAYFNHDISLADAQMVRFGSSQDSDIAHYSDNQLALRNTTGVVTFYTGGTPTERVRIDASGYIYVNTGGAEPSGSQVGISIKGVQGQNFWKSANSGTGGYDHLVFFNGNGKVGSIYTANSATTFATSSDYRLKENVVTNWDATTRLKQLKPSRFNFIADADTTVDGFIAHEVSSIVPEAITGTKDAMTAEVLYVEGDELPDGKVVGDVKTASEPDYQGIDQSKLVPLLVKTIQELEARITALEGA